MIGSTAGGRQIENEGRGGGEVAIAPQTSLTAATIPPASAPIPRISATGTPKRKLAPRRARPAYHRGRGFAHSAVRIKFGRKDRDAKRTPAAIPVKRAAAPGGTKGAAPGVVAGVPVPRAATALYAHGLAGFE